MKEKVEQAHDRDQGISRTVKKEIAQSEESTRWLEDVCTELIG